MSPFNELKVHFGVDNILGRAKWRGRWKIGSRRRPPILQNLYWKRRSVFFSFSHASIFFSEDTGPCYFSCSFTCPISTNVRVFGGLSSSLFYHCNEDLFGTFENFLIFCDFFI